ncbi:MAG: hypothetical protein AAFR52_08120 [Pseudomonadota bacterium]
MRIRTAGFLLTASLLGACATQPGDATRTATGAASGAEARPQGRPETLPANLWTTRLGGDIVEAVISDGTASLGLGCSTDGTLSLRFRPAAPRRGATTATLASRGVRIGLPVAADGRGNLRADVPTDGLLGPVLSAVEAGNPLTVTLEGGGEARFAANGAREALATALGPRGCRAA